MNSQLHRLFFGLLVAQTFISCMPNESSRGGLVLERNKSGVVIAELNYAADSVLHGPAKYYYDNAVLSDSLFYLNGLREGLHYHYDSLGNLESIIQFKKGQQDGTASWFYPDGSLQEKGFWWKGDAYGNYYWYFRNGKMASYCFYNLEGKCGYKIDFDSSGTKVKEKGRFINQINFVSKAWPDPEEGFPVILRTGDSLALEIAIASPPIYATTLQLIVKKDEQAIENRLINIGSTPIELNRQFDSVGIYKFDFILAATEKVKRNKKNEALSIVVIVNEDK
ncbi:toxin-antitoxin system YwqK family antitoxin [Phnomibacter ginsenosidimutans]|uniref:Toxin-antitoxin system YwqK family antitoxin n=1 Tax=Phnomibacter ginsenosidimutans TaxID=2676868 RepID=A0A6I6H3F7_9BACT|nr:hypothetical protein [Phnomibacter ginsenosidimutans]QGW29041.1 hypothetical protein GLV81_13855 [Phnomibacter ginsenosidimutans]